MSKNRAIPEKQASTSARVLYRPVGMVSGIVGGMIASTIFKQVWRRASPRHTDDVPGPLESEYPLREVIVAAALQGAVYAVVKTAIDRGGARWFERATGEWPGS